MPAIILKVAKKCSEEQKNHLCKKLSEICATDIGKPESHMMAVVEDVATIYFGGEKQNAAFVDVRSIGGLDNDVNTAITRDICELLSESLDINPAHVYMNFVDMARDFWGHNGKTLA